MCLFAHLFILKEQYGSLSNMICPSLAQMFLLFLANTHNQRGCDSLSLLYLMST